MRVNVSSNRYLLRDADELDRFANERPAIASTPRPRTAGPASVATATGGRAALRGEPVENEAQTEGAAGDASSDPASDPASDTASDTAPGPARGPASDTPNNASAGLSERPLIGLLVNPRLPLRTEGIDASEPAVVVEPAELAFDSQPLAIPAAALRFAPVVMQAPASVAAAPNSALAATLAATFTATFTATLAPSAQPGANERPVDSAWLQTREAALVALRADYRAALAHAQSELPVFGNVGSGWVAANVVMNVDSDFNTGQIYNPNNTLVVQLSDPNAPPVQIGWDEGGPVFANSLQGPTGPRLEFNEAAFALAFQAQAAASPSAALQSLATSYASSPAAVFTDHPSLWALVVNDHAANAGPAPAGVAMGNDSQLGMTDLYLADPQIAALIAAYGGSLASTNEPATSPMALEQVRLYGQNRYDQLTRLGTAMQSVRDQYGIALANAQAGSSGMGWVDRPVSLTALNITDESGQSLNTSAVPGIVPFERVFDPDAFTAAYIQQPGLANQAFAEHYGASRTEYATDESGRSFASGMSFANGAWRADANGQGMTHSELVRINLNDPPDLHHAEAIGFDFGVGWSTSHANIDQGTDWFETITQLVIIAAVAWVSAGTLGPAVAGSMGMSTAAAGAATTAATLTTGGIIVSAAVVGAATSLASGLLNDNLTLKGVLRGALAGALTAGLMQGVNSALGVTASSPLSTIGNIAVRTTVQGAVQQLMGGKFADGALAGLASGLAEAVSANMLEGIANSGMTGAEAVAARTFARVIGSAVRAAASPGDPGQASILFA